MLIEHLIPKDEFTKEYDCLNLNIDFCTSDYKKVRKKTLLFLIPGVNFDTYELIPDFVKSNPAAIITEQKHRFGDSKIPIIEVRSARRAYALAISSMNEIDYDKLTFIGVTGTNGKTTTATMIRKILEYSGMRVGFIGTGKIEFEKKRYTDDYYSMTSPDPDILYPAVADMQRLGCEVIVMEASSHALELEKLAPIKYKIGIFTGLSHEHLEFHESMEKYFSAKEKLIKNCDMAIINFDDPFGKRLYEKYNLKSTGIGVVWRSDVSATEVENHGLCGIGYVYKGRNFITRIKLPLPGLYNIYNSMLAFDAAYKMGITPKNIKLALEGIDKIEGRCESIFDEITVVIDYAHTPMALKSVLKTLSYDKDISCKIILVFGCGGERDPSKRPLMAKVAERYADRIILTNDNPRGEDENEILNDVKSGFREKKYAVITNRAEAITYAIKSASPGDIVLIAGKGHEKYILDKNGYQHFDEKEIIKNALKLRKHGN